MSSDAAIEVDALSKCYRIFDRPSARLKQSMMARVQRLRGQPPPHYYREFWALRDVSFSILPGQAVGIVGRNGSGKSTLLQMVCGTLEPSGGTVRTRGRITALLELGSAFNPEFSGRENVFLNAAVLGFTRTEAATRFDAIVDFADVGDFIDQPVKTYSSGMRLRLAFAVQAQLDPDILVVDEALAVGDARFQAKCFARLRQLKDNGTTILLVSHATEQIVTHCDSAILLDRGRKQMEGAPRDVVNRYLDLLFGRERQTGSVEDTSIAPATSPDVEQPSGAPAAQTHTALAASSTRFEGRPNYNPHEYRWGDGAASIVDFVLDADGRRYPSGIDTGAAIRLSLTIRFERHVVRPILGVTIKTKEGVTVFGTNTEKLDCLEMHEFGEAGTTVTTEIDFVGRLAPGDYFVSLGLASRGAEGVVPHDRRYDAIHLHVRHNGRIFGLADLDMRIGNRLTA